MRNGELFFGDFLEERLVYCKPPLPADQLLDHWIERGLIINDRGYAAGQINRHGYYRLLIYTRPLQVDDKTFRIGVNFEDVIALYEFDAKLRLLCFEAIDRVEVALRAAVINGLAIEYGSHFYESTEHFDLVHAPPDWHPKFLEIVDRLNTIAAKHYKEKYYEPRRPPIWTVLEGLTIGALSKCLSNLKAANRKKISRQFSRNERVFISWVKTIVDLRNLVAHQGRLWNSVLFSNKPMTPNDLVDIFGNPESFYARAVLLVELLRHIEPASTWKHRLKTLLRDHPYIQTAAMGFPVGWEDMDFWC